MLPPGHARTFKEAFRLARRTNGRAVAIIGGESWRIRSVRYFRQENVPLKPVGPPRPERDGELILPPQAQYAPPAAPEPPRRVKIEETGSLF